MEIHIKALYWEELLRKESLWSIGFTLEKLRLIQNDVFKDETIWETISKHLDDRIDKSITFEKLEYFKDLENFDYHTYSIIFSELSSFTLNKLQLKKMLD